VDGGRGRRVARHAWWRALVPLARSAGSAGSAESARSRESRDPVDPADRPEATGQPRAAPDASKRSGPDVPPWRPHPAAVLAAGWLAGSVPFSNVAARVRAGVDLREVGTGTVSGTALYGVAGFGPLAVAGLCDVLKGAVGPALAGRDRPELAALAAGAAVAGHNWSPWLRGAGGRGMSPAIGALLVRNWPGTTTLAIGLAAGRLRRATGLGSFVAFLALVPVLRATRGRAGALMGAAVIGPLLAKRLLGNERPATGGGRVYLHRLVFDCDPGPQAGSEAR
jgi:glycerol-3-phosphate acyltransferase PlsY